GSHADRNAHRAAAGGPSGSARSSRRFHPGEGRGSGSFPRLPGMIGLNEIADLTLEHVTMVLIAVAIAGAIGVSVGILLTRHAGLRRWALGFAGVIQTIPSLALFGFLIPIPLIGGIGKRTAIIALVLYALLPVLRNTLTGILGVDAAVRESAVAMGGAGGQGLVEGGVPAASRTVHPRHPRAPVNPLRTGPA